MPLTGASQVYQGAGGTGAAAILPEYDPGIIIDREERKLRAAQEDVAAQKQKTLAEIQDKFYIQLKGWADNDFDELVKERENFVNKAASIYADYKGYPPPKKIREIEQEKELLTNRMAQSEEHQKRYRQFADLVIKDAGKQYDPESSFVGLDKLANMTIDERAKADWNVLQRREPEYEEIDLKKQIKGAFAVKPTTQGYSFETADGRVMTTKEDIITADTAKEWLKSNYVNYDVKETAKRQFDRLPEDQKDKYTEQGGDPVKNYYIDDNYKDLVLESKTRKLGGKPTSYGSGIKTSINIVEGGPGEKPTIAYTPIQRELTNILGIPLISITKEGVDYPIYFAKDYIIKDTNKGKSISIDATPTKILDVNNAKTFYPEPLAYEMKVVRVLQDAVVLKEDYYDKISNKLYKKGDPIPVGLITPEQAAANPDLFEVMDLVEGIAKSDLKDAQGNKYYAGDTQWVPYEDVKTQIKAVTGEEGGGWVLPPSQQKTAPTKVKKPKYPI